MREQAARYGALREPKRVTDLTKTNDLFVVHCDEESFQAWANGDARAAHSGDRKPVATGADLLEFEVRQLVDVLKTEKFTRELGGQLIDAEIVRLSVHEIFQDRYVLILNCTVPYALNVFEVHLVI